MYFCGCNISWSAKWWCHSNATSSVGIHTHHSISIVITSVTMATGVISYNNSSTKPFQTNATVPRRFLLGVNSPCQGNATICWLLFNGKHQPLPRSLYASITNGLTTIDRYKTATTSSDIVQLLLIRLQQQQQQQQQLWSEYSQKVTHGSRYLLWINSTDTQS